MSVPGGLPVGCPLPLSQALLRDLSLESTDRSSLLLGLLYLCCTAAAPSSCNLRFPSITLAAARPEPRQHRLTAGPLDPSLPRSELHPNTATASGFPVLPSQLRDLGLESTDRPLELAPCASLPPSLTKLFAVESRLAQVPGALGAAIAAQSRSVVPLKRTAGWPSQFGLPVP